MIGFSEEPLWTAREIAIETDGRTSGNWFAEALMIDAHEVVAGDVFLAVERPAGAGQGHDGVDEALAAGAEGAIVSRLPRGVSEDDPRLIIVENTDTALLALARAARRRMPGKLVAIAGSVGKTGVKDAVFRALDRQGPVHAGSHRRSGAIGRLVELANIPRFARYALLEVDCEDAAMVDLFDRVVKPDVVAVTTLPVSGSDTPSMAGYHRLAGAIKNDGALVLNIDADRSAELLEIAGNGDVKLIACSQDDRDADIHPLRASYHEDCTCLTVAVGDNLLTYKAGIPGRHWVANSLVVLGIAAALEADLGLTGLALAATRPPPGRGAIRRLQLSDGTATLLDDSFDTDPLSLKAAFDVMARYPAAPGRQRIAVLSDMAAIGDSAAALQEFLTPDIARAKFTKAYVSGPDMAALCQAAGVPFETFDEVESLAARLGRRIAPGDLVLIKGSTDAGLGRLVSRLMMLDLGAAEPHAAAYAPLAAE